MRATSELVHAFPADVFEHQNVSEYMVQHLDC